MNLKIRISYELNRLAESHLSHAYEKLMPIVKCQTNEYGMKTDKNIDHINEEPLKEISK